MHFLKSEHKKEEEEYVPQLRFVYEWFSLVGLLKLEKGIISFTAHVDWGSSAFDPAELNISIGNPYSAYI